MESSIEANSISARARTRFAFDTSGLGRTSALPIFQARSSRSPSTGAPSRSTSKATRDADSGERCSTSTSLGTGRTGRKSSSTRTRSTRGSTPIECSPSRCCEPDARLQISRMEATMNERTLGDAFPGLTDIHAHPAMNAFLWDRDLRRHYWTGRTFDPLASLTDFKMLEKGGVKVLWSSLHIPEPAFLGCRLIHFAAHFTAGGRK